MCDRQMRDLLCLCGLLGVAQEGEGRAFPVQKSLIARGKHSKTIKYSSEAWIVQEKLAPMRYGAWAEQEEMVNKSGGKENAVDKLIC